MKFGILVLSSRGVTVWGVGDASSAAATVSVSPAGTVILLR